MNILKQCQNFPFQSGKSFNFFKLNCCAFIAFAFVLILSGCTNEPTSPTIDKTVIIPLKVGNMWQYSYTEYYYEGIIKDSQKATCSILKDSIYNGEKVYIYGIDTSNFCPFFYLNRSDGLYFIDSENMDSGTRLGFKFPTFKGDSYLNYEDTIRVEEVDIEYTVPAGTFKCIKYVEDIYWDNEIQLRSIYYYTPGIGLVSSEFYDRLNHDHLWLNEKTVLISYKFK